MRLAEHRWLKTTGLSLLLSLWGAAGLTCFVIWFSIVSFHAMAQSPIAYPTSIAGGLLSLAAFVLSAFYYVRTRKGHWKPVGVLLDGLTVLLSAPALFFWMVTCVYPWLQRLV